MAETNTELAIRLLTCVEAKDLQSVMCFFTENAVFYDTHYPKVRMEGRAEIAEGLCWSFNSLKKFSFNLINTYPSIGGNSVVISVRTTHQLPNGRPLDFPQLFLFEFEGDRIKSLHAYVQYAPHGVVGLMLKIARIRKVITRWKDQAIELIQR